ncbi:UNVERIFIED_CONTAM: hypothetical protein PYX00_005001 [Menopon gallinae]|uniref:Uncharacterized protein n=1 Tax=Menopon gallinae TaxID=328185 RepID=A0AAW2I7H7_9NEOP
MDDRTDKSVKYITSSKISRTIQGSVSEFAPVLDDQKKVDVPIKPIMVTSLLAGAAAGLSVDVTLYPLDTIKTRLQSPLGFRKAGAFKGVYNGVILALVGSVPASAIFFCTYNSIINYLKKEKSGWSDFWINVAAAAHAEISAAIVRVPIEMVKQRKQVSSTKVIPSHVIVREVIRHEGIRGLYRGFSFTSTVAREIPFAALQFPMWEYLKKILMKKRQRGLTGLEIAFCGAAAGAVSGALTTPMDVIKTRTMLAKTEDAIRYGRMLNVHMAREVYNERGIPGFLAGMVPRVLWITIGGFIYFGVYEFVRKAFEQQNVIPVTQSMEVSLFDYSGDFKDDEMKKVVLAQSAPFYVEEAEEIITKTNEDKDPMDISDDPFPGEIEE